jgi:tRNA-splicing ligase RtcB
MEHNIDFKGKLQQVDDDTWEMPQECKPGMRVPGKIFLSRTLLDRLENEALEQVANVAALPGIRKYSMAMPDAHVGYGFPIGGVAAFDEEEGVISPGGVGFDINCGVRLIRSGLTADEVKPQLDTLLEGLFKAVPSGVGSKSNTKVNDSELEEIFVSGVRWAVENDLGVEADIEYCEGNGKIDGALPAQVGTKARKRGRPQLGSLGSGNHFLEVQLVDEIYDPEAAAAFGLETGNITFMIHCGSRGAGHQVCTDHIKTLTGASKKYGIELPDRQLACAPAQSEEAQNYFGAMAASANYAWTNRQVIMHRSREVFEKVFGRDQDELGLDLVYDVAHNVAKLEEHVIDGKKAKVYVHRKGATRAFPAGHKDVPQSYRHVGQPVLVPGSMGTPSYVLCGNEAGMNITFGSACHGAGRVMSRSSAKKEFSGEEIRMQLKQRGIVVKAASPAVIAEEAPDVYKPSSEVVDVVHRVGIARKVARLVPLGVVKG